VDDFHQLRRPSSGGAFPRDIGASEVRLVAPWRSVESIWTRSTTAAVAANAMNKGDVLATARVAGIQAAKHAATLLPMSHLVLVGNVHVNFTIADTYIDVEGQRRHRGSQGVEMEALMAVTVAALTVYDMCKSADRTMTIEQVAIWGKVRRAIRDVATRGRVGKHTLKLIRRSEIRPRAGCSALS